ncbi:MAG TPA: anhydro-N-acetylmuramic acid kinase [Candidatus Angelobacter sp.]
MIVAGVMSGTSADGIDVALVRITGRAFHPKFEVLGHEHFNYPRAVRHAVLQTMNARQADVANLSRLNFLLGELYAQAIKTTLVRTRTNHLELVGCHGQTIYHQGEPASYLGKRISCTWQTGEAAVMAARVGVPVVSDFRPADMAVGGKGAPLVPFLDYVLFQNRRAGRILQNLGGIANLTAIPANASPGDVIAFDTGPGNMVIDQLMQMLFDKPYDRNGEVARTGHILQPILEETYRNPFFQRRPPRTAGREEFGREFTASFLRRSGGAAKADIITTATALTALAIAEAIKRFVLPHGVYRDYIVSGGGTANRSLMEMLALNARALKLNLLRTDDFGIPSQAKEAVAFALLAYQTWRRQPSNIPSATGAKRPAILGKISYA